MVRWLEASDISPHVLFTSIFAEFKVSNLQSDALLAMPLRRLTSLEVSPAVSTAFVLSPPVTCFLCYLTCSSRSITSRIYRMISVS